MLQILFYLVFVLSALGLILLILLQEGKGGGLSDAFGGAGTETFGVRAGGINKVTFGLFGVFVLSAMAIHWTDKPNPNAGNLLSEAPGGTAVPGGAGAAGGGQPIQVPVTPGSPPPQQQPNGG